MGPHAFDAGFEVLSFQVLEDGLLDVPNLEAYHPGLASQDEAFVLSCWEVSFGLSYRALAFLLASLDDAFHLPSLVVFLSSLLEASNLSFHDVASSFPNLEEAYLCLSCQEASDPSCQVDACLSLSCQEVAYLSLSERIQEDAYQLHLFCSVLEDLFLTSL